MNRHSYCQIHRVCLQCGVKEDHVRSGRRDEECPGGAGTSVVAISVRLAEEKFQRDLKWGSPA